MPEFVDTTLSALLQFPSAEGVEAFANDPEYAPYAAARQRGSDRRGYGGNNSLSAERMISQSTSPLRGKAAP